MAAEDAAGRLPVADLIAARTAEQARTAPMHLRSLAYTCLHRIPSKQHAASVGVEWMGVQWDYVRCGRGGGGGCFVEHRLDGP